MSRPSPIEGLFNRVYTSRWSPLYQSGALALFLFLVVVVSGVYLLLFYDVGAPHQSVKGLWNQAYLGRWIRSLHRYASDAAVVAILFHIGKMIATRRTWGPRLRAWVSGWILVAGIMVCGLTGFVLIWDRHAQWLSLELSRILDTLPLFTAPLPQIFSNADLPSSFFFSVLFLHVAVPLGLLAVYLVHVSRVARAATQPPGPVKKFALAALLVVSILWPIQVQPAADFSRIVGETRINLFYTGWLPITSTMPEWSVWLCLLLLAALLLVAIPLLTQPREKPAPSWVDWDSCTGCTTCSLDCPYQAISMVKRTGETAENPRRSEYVALVDPDLCVSCGICAGSCAPMGVGPPDRTGKAQLARVRAWFDEANPLQKMVVITCEKSFPELQNRAVYRVNCIGSLHTSVIEWMVRKGTAGVYLLSCPERDCHHREGPKWNRERVYNDREAELQARVDRKRIRSGAFSASEMAHVLVELDQFDQELEALEAVERESTPELEIVCEEKTPVL